MLKILLIILPFITLVFSCNNDKIVINLIENTKPKIASIIIDNNVVTEKGEWDTIIEKFDKNYILFINKKIGVKYHEKYEHGSEDVIYLGPITDDNGNTISYVLSIYNEVQAAIQIHGHSNVLFIDASKKLFKRFDTGELPIRLENNNLFFKYNDSLEYKNEIRFALPKYICIAPEDCY